MDKDRPTLPRFADIGAQHSDRNIRDNDRELSERHRSTTQAIDTRSVPTPPPIHPPAMQSYPAVRQELLYQSTNSGSLHRSPPTQSFHPQRLDRHIPSPPPSYTQPIPLLSKYDSDRMGHSQSPPNNAVAGIPNAPYASHSRSQQPGSVEGGIAKPKKLHREVEQKRRMRMAEQIVELRKWVSNPNGGKTDKVSVLQDAVTFVKESAKKIEELQEALDHSRAECAHLRSLLNKSHPHSAMPAPEAQIGPPQAHVAPISHYGPAVQHHAIRGVAENDIRRSHFGMPHGRYQERQLSSGFTSTTPPPGLIGPAIMPSNMVVADASSLTVRSGPPRQPSSQGFGQPSGVGQVPAGSIHAQPEMRQGHPRHFRQPQLHSQQLNEREAAGMQRSHSGLQRSYFLPSQEHVQGRTSDPSQAQKLPQPEVYNRDMLPRLRSDSDEHYRHEGKLEP